VSNYRSVHLPHVLDEKGTLRGLTGLGLRRATYWTEIVIETPVDVSGDRKSGPLHQITPQYASLRNYATLRILA
jgi:hypothetical protein